MKLAIMQPYFLPYIGYFQLIAAVDVFILYDNTKYTKKGWINRNRLLLNGTDSTFSLPLKHDSDDLDICERELATAFKRDKLLNQFIGAYRRAPYFEQTMPLLDQIVRYEDTNLFRFLHHSITRICQQLGITTTIEISSNVAIDHTLRRQAKVLAQCDAMHASIYINAIGGVDLYEKEAFQERGIQLNFIRSKLPEYAQFGNAFVPHLSIIDVMMFNSPDVIQSYLYNAYELI
ncbi:WbqC-like protein [Ferriphaselus amnicola]|uniref:WbqC-like protein n=2 Tax=Ferriphaselus amnicola TaxID=1188319 RepID=A0A2Z6G984_9PROT|nr:WbqC-like protein [Ferriphaselus amnicola]